MGTTSFRRRLWKTPMRDLMRGRITGRLDIDRMLEKSGLPGSAASKVRNVVKRTRLWRLEKVDVAHELIAHFLDGLEADTPIDELLETFGDERQTAKLIRRAKKRQRSVVWHAMRWFGRSVAGLFAVYLMMLGYFLMGSPDIKVDYLAILNAETMAVPEKDRAWPLYREALLELDLCRDVEWDTPIPYYKDLPPEEQEEYWEELEPPFRASQMERLQRSLSPNEPGWAETATFLRKHKYALDLIRRGAAQPSMGLIVGYSSDFDEQDRVVLNIGEEAFEKDTELGPTERSLVRVLLPQLVTNRQMAKLLTADTYLAGIEGNGTRAYENLTALLGLAEHSLEPPLIINELVRVSIHVLAYTPLTRLLVEQPGLFSDEQLRNLAHRIASVEVTFEAGLEGVRMIFYDNLQRIYTDDGHGNGRLTSEGLKMFRSKSHTEVDEQVANITLGPAAMMTMASRKEISDMYNRLMDAVLDDFHTPLWVRPDSSSEDIVQNWSALERSSYMFITQTLPAYHGMRQLVESTKGFRDGVLVGIALELYRREHGDWPETLEGLVPGYLPSVPVDRLTGDSVRYRVTGDGPGVYSVGGDGDDVGGGPPVDQNGEVDNFKASPREFRGEVWTDPEHDGDWVLWPVPWGN